jgi:hypothetical protein
VTSVANISGAVAGDEVEYFPRDKTTKIKMILKVHQKSELEDCYCAPGDSTAANLSG